MKPSLMHPAFLTTLAACWLLLPSPDARAQYNQIAAGVYAQNTNTPAANTNVIEINATSAPNDVATFSNAVAAAWATNFGGVFSFPTSPSGTILRATYGPANAKRLILTTTATMQGVGWPPSGTFNPVSYPNGTCQNADNGGYSIVIGPITDAATDTPLFSERVSQIGLTVLARTSALYPADVRITASYSDGTIEAVMSNIGNVRGTDDTFFGFTAPNGHSVTNLQLESFNPGTTTAKSTRIAFDDFGFITTPADIPPPPVFVNVSPSNYVIAAAGSGIQFLVQTAAGVDSTNISLVLNTSNVTSQLIITGDATNRSVSYFGLVPNEEYTMTISATNVGGAASLTRTFYTYTNAFTLFDCHGFTNDVLYPLGPLTAVTDGRGTWSPNVTEPAQIVDVGAPQSKALERLNTGLSRADFLDFPPLSSGTLVIEFDAFTSTMLGRTIDIALQPLGGAGATMASFLAWGEPAGKLAYFDNVNWLPISDLLTDWHHCKIINYLSGPSAGRYDVVINGLIVAQRLPWRNAVVGSAFSRFRIQSQNTGPVFDFGRIDNLVITAAPEDPNAFPPPLIVPVSPPADRAIVRTSIGLSFGVTAQSAVFPTNIGVVLNGQDVSGALQISGPDTNRTVNYPALQAETNYVATIGATNSAGAANVTLNFISTEQPWIYDPSDGCIGPWQYTSGLPEIRTASPLTANAPYLHLDILGGARNLMRQYSNSASVDLAQPHFIRWKFRLGEIDFAANFTTFNDRVHFFARNAPRLTAGTDAANSWAISATGAEQTPGSGISAGQRFWIFDNLDGTGAYNLTNLVDSQIQLFPDNVYAFEVQIFPQTQTYSVAITNETGSAFFKSTAPHKFRAAGVTATSHSLLHFGVQANTGITPRPFDFGPVSVSAAMTPAVTLVSPNLSGDVFSFSFQSRSGVSHVTKYSGNIALPSWTSLVTNIGDGTLKTVSHTNPPPGQSFYRVESQLP